MSWDHVPPKGSIELGTVKMNTLFNLMTGGEKKPKLRESQNGMRYRTICSDCNSFLGSEYDEEMNRFASSIGHYLETKIELPDTIKHTVKPQRLMKALLGHLVAAKVAIEDTLFDQLAREYVLEKSSTLPEEINVFYWIYPHNCSVVVRDFGMFTPRGTFEKASIFQTLKYFPVAYLCSDVNEYAGRSTLSNHRECGIDEEVELRINLKDIKHPYWPEAIEKDNKILYVGESGANSVHAKPKT